MADFQADGQVSIATLVGNILDHSRQLIRQEFQLVRAELRMQLRETLSTTGKGVALLAGGALFAAIGLALLGLTLVLGLTAALALPLWLSALLVTVLYFTIGAVLALVGRSVLNSAREEAAVSVTSHVE